VLLLSGCATPQVSQLQRDFPINSGELLATRTAPASGSAASSFASVGAAPRPLLPVSAQLSDVPFFAQEDYQCGPAALAMVAQHAGVKVLPEALTAQVFVPGRQGAFPVEMLAAARRQALLAYPLRPQLQDVLREVASGHPVLVFQNLSLPVYPVWHYAVVIGFDRARNTVRLHSGLTERLEMSLFTFERTWARGGHWAMLALPPSRLPATAQADTYIAAAAALERLQPAAAEVAYRTALSAWPGQRAALLGLGNAAYAQGNKEEAARRFEAATRQHGDFAEAWNNLAQVRLEQGRLAEAAQAVGRAVNAVNAAEGSDARAERYRRLQETIEVRIKLGQG
jgi:tetratricopeptide (TPR) repeat protein